MSQKRNRPRGGGQQNRNGNSQQRQQREEQPKERKPPKADRVWSVGAVYDEESDVRLPDVDRQEVTQALIDLEAVGHTLGHSFVLTPIRVKFGEDDFGTPEFRTVGWRFELHRGVPALSGEAFARAVGADDEGWQPIEQHEAPEDLPEEVRAAMGAIAGAAEEERELTDAEREIVDRAEAALVPVEEPVDATAGRPVEVEGPEAAGEIVRAG